MNPCVDPLLLKSQAVAAAVRDKGGRALLVGGFVRDKLLGLSPKDADLEIFGLDATTLRDTLRGLGRVNCVGESFQVYKLTWRDAAHENHRYELDISLPRRDRRTGRGHRGFITEADPNMTIEDATRRRDFTINAILMDPLSGEVIDPFKGRIDLHKAVLRMVDARHFGEDSLRVLRAVQFAARFEMSIEGETAILCRSIDLDDLPAERVWGEWEKLLLQATRPSIGLQVAHELGVLHQLFPEIEVAMQQREDELCAALDRAAREKENLTYPRDLTLMLATLCSFTGKKETEEILQRLRVFTFDGYDVQTNVIRLAGERKRAADWFRQRAQLEDKEFRFLSARVEPRLVYYLARARGQAKAAEWLRGKMEDLKVFDGPPAPLLMGRHLLEMGLKPGPAIGRITNAIWIEQLKGNVTTLDEAKAAVQKMIDAQNDRCTK